MIVSAKALSDAITLKAILTGSFISGSFVVNSETANDIDIVVIESVWQSKRPEVEEAFPGLHEKPGQREQYNAGSPEEEEYYELFGTYYTTSGVNIVIIKDYMFTAYYAAMMELKRRPDQYSTRDQRVAMHQFYKDVVRTMISGKQLAETGPQSNDVRPGEGYILHPRDLV